MKKTCGKCKKEKVHSEFDNSCNTKDGKHIWCKDCKKEYWKIRRRKIGKTPIGKARKAWENINSRCQNKNHKNPAYKNVELKMNRKEFLEWAIPRYKDFMEKNPGVQPSLDRINSNGHYEIENLRVISLSENSKGNIVSKFTKALNSNLSNSESLTLISQCIIKFAQKRDIELNEIIKVLKKELCNINAEKRNQTT